MEKLKLQLEINTNQLYNNINIVECGFQSADPTHDQGPLKKTEYVIQYILGGKGTYTIRGKTHELSGGDLFFLPKNEPLAYRADQTNPYFYWWLGFDGELAAELTQQIGFSAETPILHYQSKKLETLFSSIYACLKRNSLVSLTRANGYLYELFSLLLGLRTENTISLSTKQNQYIKGALSYIAQNFNSDLTVTELADHLGLNRTYFCMIFKNAMKISPMKYIMKYRIDQARKLLVENQSNVSEVAIQCGFNSISNFSVQFKSVTGYTPQQYRKAKREAIKKSNHPNK